MLVDISHLFTPEPNTGCWLWNGPLTKGGYGMLSMALAHRLIWSFVRGLIPKGLVLDHKCRQRSCVNPDHLEVVSQAENIKRGNTGITNRLKTHCAKGHELSSRKKSGKRFCRTCSNEQIRNWYYRNHESQKARQREYYWHTKELRSLR